MQQELLCYKVQTEQDRENPKIKLTIPVANKVKLLIFFSIATLLISIVYYLYFLQLQLHLHCDGCWLS